MEKEKDLKQVVLNALQEQITNLVETDRIAAAWVLLLEYIKLAPDSVDRYALEALVRIGEGDFDSAIDTLNKGFATHRASFDPLFNLGFAYQLKGDVISARNAYVQAQELAKTQEEKDDLKQVLAEL